VSTAAHFQTVRLSKGKHRSPDEGVCVMELASMLAGRSFSDHVSCVCPAIGAFLRGYNDHLDDELRQDLYACAARVLGTREGDEVAGRRTEMCRTWARQAESVRPRRFPWSLRFQARGRLDLADCELAGAHAARMACRDRAWHTWTLGFIDTLCRLGSGEPDENLATPEPLGASIPAPAPERRRTLVIGASGVGEGYPVRGMSKG